jgi:hypothetical protein
LVASVLGASVLGAIDLARAGQTVLGIHAHSRNIKGQAFCHKI